MIKMDKKIIMFVTALSFILCGCSDTINPTGKSRSDSSVLSRDIFAMDTYMNLKVYGSNAEKCLDMSEEKIIELENMLSVTNQDSDVWKINNSDGNTAKVSKDTVNIVNTAIDMGYKTDGALDITLYPVLKEWGFTTQNYKIPEQNKLDLLLENVDFRQVKVNENSVTVPDGYEVDFGSLAKGYTGDCIIDILKENNISSAIINLGGNVQTLGTKHDGSLWNVAVKNPFEVNEEMGIISVNDKAVITSGNYERFFTDDEGNKYWHILDSQDGYPADNGLVSVTIIGDEGIICDALSTALFVMGKEKATDYWRENNNFDMIFVTDKARIYITEGIEENFQNISGMDMGIIRYE